MPILIVEKDPPLTFLCRGNLDDVMKKDYLKAIGSFIRARDWDGSRLLIPTSFESNIAYIREISEEKAIEIDEKRKEMEKKRAEQEPIRRIQPAEIIPGRRRR